MQQILLNLVFNARDAMADGGIISVRTANRVIDSNISTVDSVLEPGTWVELSVRDHGTGIDEETLEHIFEPFYTTKPTGKGTGLGLPLTKSLTELHGGTLHVESEKGAGTTVTARMPSSRTVQSD